MAKNETILDKIKKLYNKAESSKELGEYAEYERFMAKVNKYLLENELNLGDIHSHEEKSKVKIECTNPEDSIFYGQNEKIGLYETDLIACIAGHNFCRVVYYTYREIKKPSWFINDNWKPTYPRAEIIGTRENIDTVKYLFEITKRNFESYASVVYEQEVAKIIKDWKMYNLISPLSALKQFESMIVQKITNEEVSSFFSSNLSNKHNVALTMLKNLGKKFLDGQIKETDFMPSTYAENMKFEPKDWTLKISSLSRLGLISDKATFGRAFLQGCVIGLNGKLIAQRKEVINETADPKATNALIQVKKDELQAFMDNKYKKLKNMGSNTYQDTTALLLGKKHGENATLSKGLNSQVPNQVKQLK